MKTALITGVNGQDGSYLSELLVDKGYNVIGTLKRNSVCETQTTRIDHLRDADLITLEYADLTDATSLYRILKKYKPDEIYNLAAQSHVRISFDQPVYTANVVALGVLNLLEAAKELTPEARIYQASSSEMFGNSIDPDGFQRETTPMNPVSPYGCAKVFGYNICRNYRHSYNMFVSNGVLFNHESPRRGTNFVTNKVAKAATRIFFGLQDKLSLGNLEATRDWGHAYDFTKAMHSILQSNKSDDYVCATGVSHSVKELCDFCFSYFGLNYLDFVITEEKHLRPEELHDLKGDSSKIRNDLGWEPKYTFESMMIEMLEYWKNLYQSELKQS